MTTTHVATARPRRGPVAHAATHLAGMHLFLMAWFWVLVVTAAVLGTWWLARLNGEVDTAVVLYARQGAIWFPFAQTIILLAAHLRVHLAAGMTRRSFVRASLVVAAGTGLGYAVVLTALAALERRVHDALGWDWRVADTVLATEQSPTGLLLAELTLACVAANVAALLVGVVYQRAGGWWGTLALPLTAGPVVGVLLLLGGTHAGPPPASGSWALAAPSLLACVGVVVLVAVVYARVTSRVRVPAAAR